MCPDGAASGNESELFPYSISGFIAEPSQSAQRPRANPAAVQSDPAWRDREGRRCVFFFASSSRNANSQKQTRGAPQGVQWQGQPRVFSFFARSYYQLDRRAFIAEDRGQHPDGRPFSDLVLARDFVVSTHRAPSPQVRTISTKSERSVQAFFAALIH